MKAYERLLSYVKIFTPSNEESTSSPSSRCQFDLARLLVEELKGLGISDVTLDDHCYVYAHLPATEGLEHCKALGFIAHMDTVSDFCDHAVTPVITENYDGKDLPLGTSGRTLSPEMFSHLTSLAGRTLITSDGTTILGADDKAGIAEILTALEHILTEKIPHGPLCVAFTPDEEIGMGPAHFNVKKFGADYAYTLDGDTEGEIQYENFNACSAKVTFQGVNVHPGSSKDTMINAALVAMEFNGLLPASDIPRLTEGYEGFFHLCGMKGDVENAETYDAWLATKDRFESLFEMTPTAVACDLHPEYLTSKWAHHQGLPVTEVQHHHSHIVSVMAEHGLTDAVCGIAFDGTGYGEDGAIWGGEVLLANHQAFERFANFAYVPMPGGAAAIKHPLRMAYGVLWAYDLLEHPAAAAALAIAAVMVAATAVDVAAAADSLLIY